VEEVILGYAGGKANFPTFNDKKDHKETIRIIFDPSVVSCEEILEHFLEQGGLSTRNSCGEKYHPIIFVFSEKQKVTAEGFARIIGRARIASAPAVECGHDFYQAEACHQSFLKNRVSEDSLKSIMNEN